MIRNFGAFPLSWQERARASVNRMDETSLIALYGAFAILLLLGTLFFSYVLPQTPGRLSRPSAELIPQFSFWSWLVSLPAPVPSTRQLVGASLLFFIALSFIVYGIVLYLSWKRSASRRALLVVIALGILLSFTNALALPNINTDIYNYIIRGRVAAVYGENPYGVAADEFPHDPIYPYASHRFTDEPGGKLPAWMALNIFLAGVSGHNPVTILLTYRLALLLFNVANLALIVLIAQLLDARYALAGAVLYAWNPIVILFAQSKTDTVMVTFVLLAVLLLVKGIRWWIPFTLLVLSALVKLITVPLIGIYVLRSLKLRRWVEVVGASVIGAILGGATLLILYFSADGGQVLRTYVGLVEKAGSSTPNLMRNLVLVAFVGATGVAGLLQNDAHRRLLVGWAVIMLFFSLFITRFTLSWYLLTPIAIVALISAWPMHAIIVALSFSSLLFNLWDTTFTEAFPAPDVVDVPRFLFYLLLPSFIMVYVIATRGWRRLRP